MDKIKLSNEQILSAIDKEDIDTFDNLFQIMCKGLDVKRFGDIWRLQYEFFSRTYNNRRPNMWTHVFFSFQHRFNEDPGMQLHALDILCLTSDVSFIRKVMLQLLPWRHLHADLLHSAVWRQLPDVVQFLLEHSVDPSPGLRHELQTNLANSNPKFCPRAQQVEIIAMLLCFGPTVPEDDSEREGLFHCGIKNENWELAELIFFCWYDELEGEVSLDSLVSIAKNAPDLFHTILSSGVKVTWKYSSDVACITLLEEFISLDYNHFKDFYEISSVVVLDLIREVASISQVINLSNEFHPDKILCLFDFLLQDNHLADSLISILCEQGHNFCTVFFWDNLESLTQVMLFLCSYGFEADFSLYHKIFATFGHCELFKVMMHMNPSRDIYIYTRRHALVKAVCDLEFEIKHFFSANNDLIYMDSLLWLSDFFVHPAFYDFVMNLSYGHLLPTFKILRERVAQQGKVPKLQEIARNAFRAGCVQKFRFKNAGHYNNYIRRLPISVVYKKIFSFESKLYFD